MYLVSQLFSRDTNTLKDTFLFLYQDTFFMRYLVSNTFLKLSYPCLGLTSNGQASNEFLKNGLWNKPQ